MKHFVALVGHLSMKAAFFAKECAENPNLGKYEKGVDDPVTDVLMILFRLTTRFKPIL